ncbi:MAG: squalene/phytoene synthase [Nitrospinae bacterium CG11_big_fil_rev_8_21_14_0_20_56_8]|nr:MAG: squalene/phytoene synthase [Nitrospinae bacterium CG11_big_fil_rev_8_21_14_0_20_56_8]
MEDWTYCVDTLPKVSRTFALNISVLRGELHRSVLVAYLFCRTIDTVEDASLLDPQIKIRLLGEFADLLETRGPRDAGLESWVRECQVVDGSPSDLDLLNNIPRAFRVFDSLPEEHKLQIVPSVVRMAKGMAYFQQWFDFSRLTPLKNEQELEEYCYFVAGVVGEMLCNLLLTQLPNISTECRQTMKQTAVSFGLGLQMTNISKDVVVDQSRGWSYVPQSFILEKGMTLEDFQSAKNIDHNLEIMEKLLLKTTGHLQDALKFTLAIPRTEIALRLFCIWPLWMALQTVAVLHNNPALLTSDAPVKISRKTVRKILRRTPLIAFSNFLLKRSFDSILGPDQFGVPPRFDLESLKQRLDKLGIDAVPQNIPSN